MKTTKTMTVAGAFLTSILFCVLVACESRTTVTETDKDSASYGTNNNGTDEKQDYKNRIDERINALESRIDSLEEMRDDQPAKKTAIDAQITKLEQRKEELKAERDRIGDNMSENWDEFKQKVNDLLDKAESEIKEHF